MTRIDFRNPKNEPVFYIGLFVSLLILGLEAFVDAGLDGTGVAQSLLAFVSALAARMLVTPVAKLRDEGDD